MHNKKFMLESLKGKHQLEDTDIDVRIIYCRDVKWLDIALLFQID